jgi:molybdopterin-guanine dinucleotide biosynthesis protein A
MDITGLVLAGGQSKRMGKDKAFLTFKNRTFLRNILESLNKYCNQIVIVINKDQSLYAKEIKGIRSEITFVKDIYPYEGPLNGILSGVEKIKNELVYITPCDTPLLNPDIIPFFAEIINGYDAVVPNIRGKIQPLNALYKKNALKFSKDVFEKERKKSLMAFLEKLNVKYINEEEIKKIDKKLYSYFSVNTPDSYQTLLKIDEKENE